MSTLNSFVICFLLTVTLGSFKVTLMNLGQNHVSKDTVSLLTNSPNTNRTFYDLGMLDSRIHMSLFLKSLISLASKLLTSVQFH